MGGCIKCWGQDYPGCANREPARATPMDKWDALRRFIVTEKRKGLDSEKVEETVFDIGKYAARQEILDEMARLDREEKEKP